MSLTKITTKQWQKFSKHIAFSKQAVEELSKLYIVIHQKVKASIKKSVVSPHIKFSQQAEHHIYFIKNVLERINNAKNDQYLHEIDQNMLQKYEKSLLGLLSQIDVMLKIDQSKVNLNLNVLKAISPQKRKQYDLKDQVTRSSGRMIRAKSGQSKSSHKYIQHKTSQLNKIQQNDYDRWNDVQFQQKGRRVEQKMHQLMQQTDTGLSFQKKYQKNNLQMYLKQRRQFADLIMDQEAYQSIINQRQLKRQNIGELKFNKTSRTNNSTLLTNGKLFPEFQLKTKFLKPKVKQEILNVIMQVKHELLQFYSQANIAKLKKAKEQCQNNPQDEASQQPIQIKFQKRRMNLAVKDQRSSSQFTPRTTLRQNKRMKSTQHDSAKAKLYSKMSRSTSHNKFNTNSLSQIEYKKIMRRKHLFNNQNFPYLTENKYHNHLDRKLKLSKI